ncbi:mitochondrial inner membrane protein-domain-containing protein [Tricharina praecox]|uniref:mitochondrial inner membrane protein-domain-containing protein n=1 Tax=Tricharina praecox TaxID=43433 RepID=UPI00221E4861|nr:mitochondrial inner membrane protein-domain-containing protein [Tricharina praecox]KAI5858360.1 mitochondrial inner membrane protein-domain-containing protein [Tricharina praecox]
MLRLPSSSVRAIARAAAPRVHLAQQQRRALANTKIPYPPQSVKATIKDSKPPVLPGGASNAAPPAPAPAKAASAASPPLKTPTPLSPASSVGTSPTQVPLTPPSPPKIQTSPPQSSASASPKVAPRVPTPPPTPPPPPPPASTPPPAAVHPVAAQPIAAEPVVAKPGKKTHKFRNFLVGLTLLTGGSFAAGVFYSLKSDNVHDFFTEYVPLGEEAVLYFEEREFRRRFPNALSRIQRKVDSPKVTIPKSSGASWKVVDRDSEGPRTVDVGKPGPHLSSHRPIVEETKSIPADGARAEAKTVDVKSAPQKGSDVKKVEAVTGSTAAPKKAAVALASVELSNASDPVVQDLVKVVNNLIETVNKTESGETFGAVIDAAKAELKKVNDQVGALKVGMEKAVEDSNNQKDLEFAKAAQGLLKNVNNQVEDLEHQLRDDFEAERERIAMSYQRKLQTELERSRELSEQRLRNELLEQAIEMKRSWISEIESRVEKERGGRLGKLKELEAAVAALEQLTSRWNDVIDTNLKTQRTFTALEAVKASYESPDQPKPFLREMAALKEVAEGNDVVTAAIDSINPAAYQNGVVTHTQLVDKFRKLSGEVRRAALLPEDAGIAAHAGNWVLSKLMFKKSGLAQGNDVESILAKTETYLEEGDVDSAAREMNQLSGWARTLASDWLREARLLLEVKQAVDIIAAEARIQSMRVQSEQ